MLPETGDYINCYLFVAGGNVCSIDWQCGFKWYVSSLTSSINQLINQSTSIFSWSILAKCQMIDGLSLHPPGCCPWRSSLEVHYNRGSYCNAQPDTNGQFSHILSWQFESIQNSSISVSLLVTVYQAKLYDFCYLPLLNSFMYEIVWEGIQYCVGQLFLCLFILCAISVQ